MIREINNKEAEAVYNTAITMLERACPIKTPIKTTLIELQGVVAKYMEDMDTLILKHAELNSNGEPVQATPTTEGPPPFPFALRTPELFFQEKEALDSITTEVEFTRGAADAEVLVQGESFKLAQYLEATVDLPAKLALFLLEYFVDEV